MTKYFYAKEITRPEDIIPFLAKQELHWKQRYSAYELAHSWVLADGIPTLVRSLLDTCPDYQNAQLVEGFFERDIDLRTAGRRSQTDLMAFIRVPTGYAVLAIEGKVDESFGPLISEWHDRSHGREQRLTKLCSTLGLDAEGHGPLRYQLFHRTVSAIYEAQRYHCDMATMLVHSFSPTQSSFADFVAFTNAMGVPVSEPNTVSSEKICEGIRLRFAWCADKFW
jgi:hypothetical protein